MESLKEIRKTLGFTQEQTANLLNISRRSYQYYEKEENINTSITNLKYEQIFQKLKEMLPMDGGYLIYPINKIKEIATTIFKKYPEIQCAYLFGSYARKEATPQSDIDFMLVAPSLLGFKVGGLMNDLREAFKKDIDIVKHESLIQNELLLRYVLTEGIKIYEK